MATFGETVTVDDVSIDAVVTERPTAMTFGNVLVEKPDPTATLKQADIDALGDSLDLKPGATLTTSSGTEYRVTFVGRSDYGMVELTMRPA